jgi:hypothetical protein
MDSSVNYLFLDVLELFHSFDPHLKERAHQVALGNLQLPEFVDFVPIFFTAQALEESQTPDQEFDLIEVDTFDLSISEVSRLEPLLDAFCQLPSDFASKVRFDA